jgi:hypothetical protein
VGKLLYGDADIGIDIDDRALAHIQVVIGAKLRRGECFFFSWTDDRSVGGGRSSIWLQRSILLYFRYSGSKNTSINREWLKTLTRSANSGQGLIYTLEPDGPTSTPGGHV